MELKTKSGMDLIAERLAQAYPKSNRDAGVRVTSRHERLVQNVRLSLYMLQAAVLLVLPVAVKGIQS